MNITTVHEGDLTELLRGTALRVTTSPRRSCPIHQSLDPPRTTVAGVTDKRPS
jgi:hypothetical protein